MKIITAYAGARCDRCKRYASNDPASDARLVELVGKVAHCARCVEDKLLAPLRMQAIHNEEDAFWTRGTGRGGRMKGDPELVVGHERPSPVPEPPATPAPRPLGEDAHTAPAKRHEAPQEPAPDLSWKVEAVRRRREILAAQAKARGITPTEAQAEQHSEDKWSARLAEPHEDPKVEAQRRAARNYLSRRRTPAPAV